MARIQRERAVGVGRGNAAGNFASGVGSALGLPFGAGPLAGGLAVGLGVAYSSRADINLERSQQALKGVYETAARAEQQFQRVSREADRLGISVSELAMQYARFQAAAKGTDLEGEKATQIFLAVAESAQIMGLRADETEGVLRALGQIMSKGKVQAEELRGQLGDRLSGAFQLFAKAIGVSTAELDDMLKKGGVIATETLPSFGRQLRSAFGTDANTRIETTISNFTRLTSEINLSAAALGKFINSGAGPLASGVTNILSNARQTVAEQGGGLRSPIAYVAGVSQEIANYIRPGAVETVRERNIRRAPGVEYLQNALTPSPTGLSFVDPAIARLKPAVQPSLTGMDLLTSGVDAAANKELEALRLKGQLIGENNAARRLELEIQSGLYAGESELLVAQRRRNALAEDAETARRKAEQTGTRQAKRDAAEERRAMLEQEKLASDELFKVEEDRVKALKDAAEQNRKAIIDQVGRNLVLQEELRTGEKVTNARREQLEIQARQMVVTQQSLAAELDIGEALEKQIRLDAERMAKATALNKQLDDGLTESGFRKNVRAARRGEAGALDLLDLSTSRALASEDKRYGEDKQTLSYGREQEERRAQTLEELLAVTERYNRREQELAQQHEDAKSRIAREASDARKQIQANERDAVAGSLGQIAEAAQLFGEKGFKAYKAAATAQAIIATYSSAVKAYDSVVSVPYIGPALGVAAAGAAVALGLAQVAAIQSQTYGGGREFGGPVRPDQFYEIGERRKPEVVESQGRFYMFNASGKVTPAAAATPAANSGGNIRIVNAFDVGVIGDYFGSAEGDRVIVNAVRRNGAAMRSALGVS